MKDLTGTNLRGYEILEKIGQGGAGAVYRANQPDVNREVAVKIILPEHANKPEFAQRFAIEGRLIARLEHPHIIPLYDYWQDAQGAYLVMRWLRGGTLRQVLEMQGALSLAQTARLLDQMAEALMAAHQLQVIHRDLKPENILLDERGNAYLTDFGIAKALEDNVHITGENAMLGTPAYLAPEQIRGETVSPRSDLYSLGIMLYEMLCGHHPYQTDRTTALLVRHLHDPLPNLHECRPDLPYGLDAVLQQATAKNPAYRFPDAMALADAFHSAAHLTPQAAPLVELPTAIGLKTPPDGHLLTPNDTDSRNRYAMLQNVSKFWIEGVLQNSLRGAALVELGMSEAVDKVDTAWNAVLRDLEDSQEIALPNGTSIINVFDQMNGKLLILGDPGSGKTTTLLRLTRDLLYRSRADEQHPIPVIFNLSTWAAERQSLDEWLVTELNARYQVPAPVAAEWVQMDRLLLLLDGLDEVALQHRDACVLAINAFRQTHGFADVVVCSRISDYEALTHQLKLNGAIVLKPLDDRQINAYLEHVGDEVNPLRAALAEDDMLRDMAQSPLMLGIMTLVYRGTSARELLHLDTPEARRKHIFDRYISRMLGRRGDSPYSMQTSVHYLAWLARQMVERAASIFYIEGLQPSWLNSRLQEQQYLWMVAGLHGVLYSLIVIFVSIFVLGMPSLAYFFLPVGFLMGFGANFIEVRRRKIQPVEAFRWSWRGLWEQYRVALPPALGLGTFVGVAWYVAYDLKVALAFGVVTALNIYGIQAGVVRDAIDRKVKPNEGIWRSLRNGWQVTVLLGLIFVLPIWLLLGWRFGLAYMMFSTIGSNILGEPSNRGSAVVVRHGVLRWLLHRKGHIPMNYADFLDEMSKRVLLRKVGGGYIFVHRLLLEYFATLNLPDSPASIRPMPTKTPMPALKDEDLITA